MILFQTKYQLLVPRDGFLKDMVVLAQASGDYRTHCLVQAWDQLAGNGVFP